MAFEFQYSIELMIVHPSIDPSIITKQIIELRPRTEIKVGTEIVSPRGFPTGRKAQSSVWSASLHDAKRLYSEVNPISQFIGDRLTNLERHREFLRDLSDGGYVVLRIDWFSETSHSASCLESGVVRRCADFGLGIELNFYASVA